MVCVPAATGLRWVRCSPTHQHSSLCNGRLWADITNPTHATPKPYRVVSGLSISLQRDSFYAPCAVDHIWVYRTLLLTAGNIVAYTRLKVQPSRRGEIIPLQRIEERTTEIALRTLERVYTYVYQRVGNRADAEDLTQEVAMKAMPRLRPDASAASIRGYLFTTARTELARYWTQRLRMPEEALPDDLVDSRLDDFYQDTVAMRSVRRILCELPENYARVLDLRFLRGYSAKEMAREIGTTVGGVRIMQLRALRAAARLGARD